MRIGKLRHKVSIQKLESTQDALGGKVESYTHFCDAWAEIRPVSGREYFIDNQRYARCTHSIIVRFVPGITPSMRVLFNDRVFDIEAVLNAEERNIYLRLLAVEDV